MDVELVDQAAGPSRFERVVAVAAGVAALLAALTATLQSVSGHRELQAQTDASQLAVLVVDKVAVSGLRTTYFLGGAQQGLAVQIGGTARRLAALEGDSPLFEAIGRAEEEAGGRLSSIITAMGRRIASADELPEPVSGALKASLSEASRLATEQGDAVDRADRAGAQGNRAGFALTLIALGAVLLGLSAVIGAGRTGSMVLGVALVSLAAGAVAGGSALLL